MISTLNVFDLTTWKDSDEQKNIGQNIDDDTAVINLSPWQSGEFELPPLLDVHVQAQSRALYSPADDPSSLACVYGPAQQDVEHVLILHEHCVL